MLGEEAPQNPVDEVVWHDRETLPAEFADAVASASLIPCGDYALLRGGRMWADAHPGFAVVEYEYGELISSHSKPGMVPTRSLSVGVLLSSLPVRDVTIAPLNWRRRLARLVFATHGNGRRRYELDRRLCLGPGAPQLEVNDRDEVAGILYGCPRMTFESTSRCLICHDGSVWSVSLMRQMHRALQGLHRVLRVRGCEYDPGIGSS